MALLGTIHLPPAVVPATVTTIPARCAVAAPCWRAVTTASWRAVSAGSAVARVSHGRLGLEGVNALGSVHVLRRGVQCIGRGCGEIKSAPWHLLRCATPKERSAEQTSRPTTGLLTSQRWAPHSAAPQRSAVLGGVAVTCASASSPAALLQQQGRPQERRSP